jgi:hypothetical protein
MYTKAYLYVENVCSNGTMELEGRRERKKRMTEGQQYGNTLHLCR